MFRYYFNIRRGDLVFEDRTGAMLSGIPEAWTRALKEVLTLDREGWLDRANYQYWVEICDAHHCAIVSFPVGPVTMQ